ncbi:MAG TPA: isochorismatase family protein [Vicinamibacterales bacterium]|nr:isochorismatase family protein [Vicinamibacterales bacterium]
MLAARLVILPGASDMLSRHTALVVIDAQRAFVDREGSLVRTFGIDEAQPGLAALDRLRQFVAEHRSIGPTIFVRSEYRPGQFTNGDLNHGMAYVCVPGENIDCEWATGVDISPHDVVVTKHHADAATSPAFRSAIEQAIEDGAAQIVVAGFQLTTCVVASALSTFEMVRARGVRVTVVEALTGSRASSHVPDASGVSRVEATRRALETAGVEVILDVRGD